MPRAVRCSMLTAGVLTATIAATAGAAQAQERLALYKSERYGVSLTYPADFIAFPSVTEEARQFMSRDTKARLLVGTANNSNRLNLAEYRDLLLRDRYASAKVDYTALRGNWFVVSGDRDGMTFYERVTLTCGGRRINSWAMTFPTAEKPLYERVIEQVHRSYRITEGRCDPASVAAK
jgi:hypothetical protein